MAFISLACGIFFFFFFFFFSFSFFAISLANVEANPTFSFQFESFNKTPNFPSQISLHGDARIINSTVISSSGQIMYKKPIRFLGTSPGFSTEFSFSIPESNGKQTLAFLMGHGVSSTFLLVEFGSCVRIDVGSEIFTKSSNLSASGLVLNSGQRLHSWIDYNGFSKRIEVSLNTSGASRPSNSLISYAVDLSNFLWREPMLVGISSLNPNLTQFLSIYSWMFVAKHGQPYLMHSEPFDPSLLVARSSKDHSDRIRREYYWRITVVLVIGAVFSALVVLIVSILWSSVVKQHPVAPMEYSSVGIVYEKLGLDSSSVEGDEAAK